jgi:hypothetical protein
MDRIDRRGSWREVRASLRRFHHSDHHSLFNRSRSSFSFSFSRSGENENDYENENEPDLVPLLAAGGIQLRGVHRIRSPETEFIL